MSAPMPDPAPPPMPDPGVTESGLLLSKPHREFMKSGRWYAEIRPHGRVSWQVVYSDGAMELERRHLRWTLWGAQSRARRMLRRLNGPQDRQTYWLGD